MEAPAELGDWRLGLLIAAITSIPLIAIMAIGEAQQFAGLRRKLAAALARMVPFAAFRLVMEMVNGTRVERAEYSKLRSAEKR